MFRKSHTRSTKTAEPIGDTFKSNNIAARMGRWSASHWKTAVLAWLVFVVAAFATSIFFPLQLIQQKDAGVGESAKANKILDKSFDLDQTGQFEFAVAPARALDAFRHPFVYAGSEVEVGAPLHTQEVAA